MPPKGANAALERRLQELRATMAGKTEPDLQAVKDFFTDKEKHALWNKLKTELGKADVSVRDAWDKLVPMNKELGKVKPQSVKNQTLATFACFKEGWQTRLMRSVEAITKSHSKTVQATPLTRGQLNTQHGEEEAQVLIDKGWFDSYRDESGEEIFIKRSKARTFALNKLESTELKRSYILMLTECVPTAR